MMKQSTIIEILKSKKSFLLVGHAMPDGDALGSVLALGMALKKMGKQVQIVMPDPPGEFYSFLPEFSSIIDVDRVREDEVEVVVALDCASMERTKGVMRLLEQSPCVINIDHHVSNTNYGDYNLVKDQVSATGEIVYEVIRDLGVALDASIATCIFVAIATDTGSFKYANTTSQTHQVIAELMTYDINPASVMRQLFDIKPLAHMHLLGVALKNLKMDSQWQMAWTILTQEDFDDVEASNQDAEGIIDHVKAVAGIEVAVFFRETENRKVKVGFRSHEWVDVNEIAQQFGGGGHARAAGCLVKGPISEVVEKVLKVVMEKVGDGSGRYH